MSAPNSLEKKLDRYYEDIIDKIMELIETQKNVLGEQKELRKDVAKLKEHLLEAKTGIEQIEVKISNLGKGVGGGTLAAGNLKTTFSSPTSHLSSPAPATPPATTQGGPQKSLKDFLAQEVAIFDVKVLNAFIKSTKEIVKTNTRTEPVFLKPIIEAGINLPIVIAGRMQLARDKGKGSMAYCMELESASAITRAVFMLPDDAKVTEADIKDVTSEICNQICGKSKLALKTDGYSFEIGLPEIHQGQPKDLLAVLGAPKVALFFEYLKKPFYVLFWG
jgi:CheY-specific phosphatase CheX